MNLVERMEYADKVWAEAQSLPPTTMNEQVIATLYEAYLTATMTRGEREIYRSEAVKGGKKRTVAAEVIASVARRVAVDSAIDIASRPLGLGMPELPSFYRSPDTPNLIKERDPINDPAVDQPGPGPTAMERPA